MDQILSNFAELWKPVELRGPWKHSLSSQLSTACETRCRVRVVTLDARFLPDLPWYLIGDRGYGPKGLDDLLMTRSYGIEMIAANRRGRAKTQDGRPLRRATRRWKIERLLPAPQLPPRGHPLGATVGNYLGMVQLACARILLRAFWDRF